VAFLFQSKTDYLDAGAAGAEASAAGAAGADASAAGAGAATGAGAGAGSSFLPQAASAAAARMVANRSDFVMSIFLKWMKQFLEVVMVCTKTELMESPPLAQPHIIG
jgi:hypothetical protein